MKKPPIWEAFFIGQLSLIHEVRIYAIIDPLELEEFDFTKRKVPSLSSAIKTIP